MNWTNYLQDASRLKSIYSSDPELKGVRLHEVRLHQDGPRVSLRIDLNTFPSKPPQKWACNHFNRVQITLALYDVTEIRINGFGLNNIGDVNISQNDSIIFFEFIDEGTQLICRCKYILLDDISAYHDSKA